MVRAERLGPWGEMSEMYVTSFEPGSRPSECVIDAVATISGVSPTELQPLYDAIEPDALDALFDPVHRPGREPPQRLTFYYADYEITVCGDATVEVRPVDGYR